MRKQLPTSMAIISRQNIFSLRSSETINFASVSLKKSGITGLFKMVKYVKS